MKQDIKKVTVVNSDKKAEATRFVITRISDDGQMLTYNSLGFWTSQEPTTYNKKEDALNIIAKLCESDKTHPVFLCAF